MANNIIKGRKGGGSKQRTPTEQPDDLQSVAKAKILLALGEGEFAGGLTGEDIYLDGTPLENADGSQNFSGVSWEFRPGTQAQTYIQGIPGTENEISVGTEVSSKTAWTHTFTNTQLSAVRVRLKWPSLMKQEDDGDVVGNTVKYAIDLQTDGGAWQTVLETAVTGKTTSGYERSHRIDLPQAGSTWTLRLRKISPDANSVKVGDVMTLQSYTEVIDAKLRYPNTALLYIEFDSSQFNGSIPQISCEPRGRVIRVPDNYNPETREYTGVWTGGFKWAWTDNPAWIYYDIVIADRFGLGNRLSSANISKWTLYQIAQYCDQLVPDGRGGDGMEPRYTCNVYVQERNDAYTVLRDFAAIFRGMTCWNGEQIVVQADMPRDVDFTYTRANIIGKPRYSSSSSQVRYTNALVSWSDPDNAYADAMEPAFIPELVSRYSFNQLEMTAIGCTRQSEAHRKGLWGILTNNKDRMVEIDVGLDGRIPQPGYIIALADELLAGRVNGGRISAVNGRVITLDRDVDAKPGDRLQLNLPSGISQSRTIQAVNGRRQITVTTAYSETPERECVWAIESDDLFLQQYRVTGVKENSDATLTITGVAHDPDKFPRIDTGAIIDQRPVSVLPAGNQSPPDDIVITSRSVVNQGISVETMQVNWSAVSGAIAYEAQWRRNDGNWINVPRSSTTSFEVSGIYAGRYLVRVRAINAAEISSGWAYSEEKTLTGKVGEPLAPLALATRSLVHGVQVSWEFPTGSGDTLRTELQYSKNQDGSAPMPLSDVAYPGKSYQQMGLSMGAEFWYRARLVDRLDNESPWTGWVQGMASDNFDDYYENLTDAIKDTDAWEETQRTISETQEGIRNTQQELEQTAEELRQEAADQAKQVSQDIDASAKSITADVDGKISAVNKTITDELTSVNESLDSGLAQANKGIQEAKSAVADANQQIAILSKSLADGDAALNAQIKTAENGLKQSLSQVNTTLTNAVKQETADRIADVNAKAAQAADELLAATQGIEASIESLTQVMKSADENLAREMSSLAAGANIQFDSQVIWHFNNQTTEGWTGSAGVPGVSQDGWLRPADSATDPYITSPGGLAVDGAAYRFIMLRFRKTGKPVWAGEIRWVSAGENFNNTKRYIVAEPEYADGVATLTVRDIPWTGNIDRIRLDLTNQQDASNFIEFDWIAVGRPAPGASTAALQDVRSTLSNALTAEAQARSTLAAQMRGSYEGSDLEKVTSGLLYQEKTARVTAISAEVKARESLQTQFNDNKAAVSGELSSLTTEQSAQASRIGGLETSLGKKADATALTSLTQKVEQQGATLTSQGAALTSLTNRVGQTETGLAGTNEALSGLESTVTQQGDRITSQGQSITKLTSDLGTTNAALEKKAEASAVTALTQQVEQNGQDIRSNTNNLTSLSNRLVNGLRNSWSRRIYPIQLASGVALPSFSDIRAVAPTTVDEVADTTKLDFTFAGSYLVALYSCQVKVAANTTVTMGPGSRVFDDTGVVFVNGVQVAWGNASTSTVSFELKAGWNTVEFLVNQWTGQAYINLGLKLSDKVDEMYSGLGVSALSNAAGVLSSNVSQIGKDVVSNSQSITQLRNSLTQTDANVAGKADQTALNSLTGRVENTETGLTAANSSITSLNTSLSQQSRRGANLLPDGTFESYPANYNLSNNRVIVSTDDSHGGNKCIRVTRPNDYNATGIDNSDNHIFSGFQVRDNAVFYLECWIKLDAKSTAMADNVQISVGLSFQYQDESWQWPAVTKAAKDLSSTQWTKVSGYLKSTKSGVKQAMFRISVPNVSSVKAGNSFLIDDIVLTEVTDAYNAQNTADANASAISTLNSTVSQQGDQLTSQGNSITKLTNDLATTNNNVSKKADATALTTLANRVTQTEKDITSTSSSVTTLNNKVDSISVGGTNLIKNSGAMTGWSNVISETYRGNAVLGATTKAGSGYKDLREITLDAPVDAGEYVYSFYAKGAVDGQPMTVFFYNPNTTKSSETSQGIKSGNTDGRAYFTLTTSWARYWVKWKHTPTTGTKRLILCRIESNASNDQTVYISSPKLEVGNVVSDWNNSPTDSASASAVDLLTTTVNQHSDTITSIGNRTTSLENGLSTTNANVAKKADASSLQTLQNTVTQQGNDISSQGTRVTAIENSLTSGANLIPNAKMLNNAQGWDGNATTVDGYAAVSSARGWQPSSAPFEVTPGDTLDLSLMCLVDAAITFAWGLRFDGPSLNNKTVYTNNLSYQAGEKKAVSGTFVVPVGATTARLQPNIGVTAGVTIYNVVVTRRDATTIANSSAIDSLTSTVKTQGDAISSIGNRTTSLENGLATAQNDIGKKADASALQDLRNTVISQGGDLTAANSNITKLQASINRRTVFTVAARGLGSSVPHGVFDESGNNLFTPGRSWALITFAKHSDGSTVIATSKTYDVFGSANNGATMSADIEALASGTYVCVLTFDEPSGNRGKILSALESLGGTSEVVNSLPYRGAYILLGRKGMRPGDGLELRAPTGGDATAHISTSVEFVNGVMMGLGAAGGVMMKADANASAITTLQNTVKAQGGNIDSLSSSVTALENSLRSTNDTVSKKADTSAVSSLTGRVSQVEKTITSQSQSITSLTSTINTIRTQGANPWVDGTFESYGDGHVLGGGGTAVVVASQKFTGNKSLQVSRKANNNGNSDKQLGSWQSVREDAKFRFEFWAMMPADQKPSSGWTTLVGINSLNAAGQNSWQSAVTVSEAALGARDKWVKFTGIASNNGGGRTRAVVWISTRGASGSGTPGYSLYIDDLVITDVTDAKAAQDASDATASAVSGLTARVTDAEGKITAQAQQQAALATKVDNANSRVDNMAKTLSDSQNTQASLNTSLQSQIDAQAAANIKNQTTLDNTIKSVASITSTQQTHATALEALATQQTTLTSSVGDLSASVQNTAKTVAAVNGTVSSLWSMKVETVNGKKVGAGITLGSNGETSDIILYADRFSLFNRNNATAVPVMVAEGNELYIDTARIKNSSLTSTKIADGSITNAKIGNEIRSNDFVDGSRGWRIAKDGSSQFNNVIVRGAVYATDGWFQGTVYANHIEGDIGSFAINIAQHRTRKVPKATWQWFELARFRRQNFDQVINIRGGLLQTDSITIYGGAKLRAGMSYAPGADGGLNPGYLSYAMLLRGTGATSGGGSMELGIELMYETGGATRLLTAQESMNVDNMSFVVPAGTGDAVLRYGCYLDRNGQMVFTILSRFDAFAARNNNVIRGSST
ncbi:TPA: TipJ family phage tail tip protein [Klebsiella pneumoniae]